jgi:hypothetical protein
MSIPFHESRLVLSPMVDGVVLQITELADAVDGHPCPEAAGGPEPAAVKEPAPQHFQLWENGALARLAHAGDGHAKDARDRDVQAHRSVKPDGTSLLSRTEATLHARSSRTPHLMPVGGDVSWVALPVFGMMAAYAACKCRNRARRRKNVAIAPVAAEESEIRIVQP